MTADTCPVSRPVEVARCVDQHSASGSCPWARKKADHNFFGTGRESDACGNERYSQEPNNTQSALFGFHGGKPQVSGIVYRVSFLPEHRARFFGPIDSSPWSLYRMAFALVAAASS